ncbi:hypothetical protein ACFV0C_00020 [Streptomyces sp. NPDC059568]|uniref:hypothetical protein n=1 Tax=Streptomyces sp. NPDC059568 TaxID=3346868 RepID=UPI00368FCEDD
MSADGEGAAVRGEVDGEHLGAGLGQPTERVGVGGLEGGAGFVGGAGAVGLDGQERGEVRVDFSQCGGLGGELAGEGRVLGSEGRMSLVEGEYGGDDGEDE